MDELNANLDASFYENVENGMPCHHLKGVRPKPKRDHSALLKCRSALQKCQMVLLDAERSSLFGCILDSLFRVFLSGPCTQTCFHPQSIIFISIIDNLGFFKNNYLVDKYPKINLDKVHIIHNFIVIQSSLLFLCMQSYFKH